MSPIAVPRRGRDDEPADTPVHFERVRLRPSVRVLGWPAAGATAACGIALAVARQGSPLEVVGALVATVAGLALLGLFRCGSFEIVVGRRWLQGRAGPLSGRAPIGLVETIEQRPATGWRRCYSRDELVVGLGTAARALALPTADPGELARAVGEMRARSKRLSTVTSAADEPPGRSP